MNIVLLEPEIPANTGNIGRTCVATGSSLHLIDPLGFRLDEKHLKRAGMDYWQDLDLHRYTNWADFTAQHPGARLVMASTKGQHNYCDFRFRPDDYIIFGKESAGIPEEILIQHPDTTVRIPMVGDTRSLNLGNSVAIVLYEALRQLGFGGFETVGQLHRLRWETAAQINGPRESRKPGNADLQSEVQQLYAGITRSLIERGLTISTMESCTSGLIASLLTDTEGASAIYPGGFVTYSNSGKETCGVPADIISSYGVYSPETADAMARAAAVSYGTDLALGVTGTFGNPDPANADSVCGQVHYAIYYGGTIAGGTILLGRESSRLGYKQRTALAIGRELLHVISQNR